MKAFPSSEPIHGDDVIGIKQSYGMELRDYFAAKFIPEVCKHSVFNGWDYENNAKICYAMADAMMAAREKK